LVQLTKQAAKELDLLLDLTSHLLKTKDALQIKNLLGGLTRKWLPTIGIHLEERDICWQDYLLWASEQPLNDSNLPVGLESKFFARVVALLHESKEKHITGAQIIADLTIKWIKESKAPSTSQQDPLNGVYFGVSAFAHYIGYLTASGEQKKGDKGSTLVISNDAVANLTREFVKNLMSFLQTQVELSNLDLVGILSVLFAETSRCRGRRWHDFDLINRMVTATVTAEEQFESNGGLLSKWFSIQEEHPPAGIVKLSQEELKLLNELVARKFRLLNAVKDMFSSKKE
jgi:hypothetical protein